MKPEFKPKIGRYIINLITNRLYKDARDIYREYVQNASDSLAEARRIQLNNINEGYVDIAIDPGKSRIEIVDNGTGVPYELVDETLLNIACSQKNPTVSAGQFGIGRLVGAGYCDLLIFETSYEGEEVKSVIRINTKELQETSSQGDTRDAMEVFEDAISTDLEKEDSASHYFKVILEGIREKSLLDVENVKSYLQEVAPVDFYQPFKHLMENKADAELLKRINNLPRVDLRINGSACLCKKYSCKNGNGDDILGFQYFELKDETRNYGWGWVAITNFSTALKVDDANRCLRLRMHNIQVGNRELLSECFRESRGNHYFVGELHITHPDVRPTTARDGLERGTVYDSFMAAFKDNIAAQLYIVYRRASEYKREYKDIANSSQQGEAVTENHVNFLKKLEGKGATFAAKILSVTREGIAEQYSRCISSTPEKTPVSPDGNGLPHRDKDEVLKGEQTQLEDNISEASPAKIPDGWEILRGKYFAESISLAAEALKIAAETVQCKNEEALKETVVTRLATQIPVGWEPLCGKYPIECIILAAKVLNAVADTSPSFDEADLKKTVITKLASR